LRDEARALKLREQKSLRDEAGMRAGGGYKRPVTSQHEPSFITRPFLLKVLRATAATMLIMISYIGVRPQRLDKTPL
jgi:hypothetical protein